MSACDGYHRGIDGFFRYIMMRQRKAYLSAYNHILIGQKTCFHHKAFQSRNWCGLELVCQVAGVAVMVVDWNWSGGEWCSMELVWAGIWVRPPMTTSLNCRILGDFHGFLNDLAVRGGGVRITLREG